MNLPVQIGHYHILGRIAYGGMAEILLAKVLGPGGFERPVVIKRVLPHMAAEREFRDMFLDEARIVASIHHPNVVQVHELRQEGDELYLVMEYLAGESVRSLCARAAARGARLDFGLCAHIVAEACAGLHAAHEFTGPDGNVLQVVHRDVCPSNLIVTYEGSVKVVDFGIALAANRFTMTDAGQVKGKAAYMAPEQCMGEPIDRRTDVFALGVVLYELSTGHRLFADALESRVVACLKKQEAPPPSSVVRDYPKELERICMQALRSNPSERFASAEQMRRELVRFQHARAAELLPEEQLKRSMHDFFEDRIGEKSEMLQQLRAGSGAFHIPSAEITDEVTRSVVHLDEQVPQPGAFSAPLDDRTVGATRASSPRKRRMHTRLVRSAVLTTAATGLIAAALSMTEFTREAQLKHVWHLAQELVKSHDRATVPLRAAHEPTNTPLSAASPSAGEMVKSDDPPLAVPALAMEPPDAGEPPALRLDLPSYEALEKKLSRAADRQLSLVLRPLEEWQVAETPPAPGSSTALATAERDNTTSAPEADVSDDAARATADDAESKHRRQRSDPSEATEAKDGAEASPDHEARSRRMRADKRADEKAGTDFFLFD